MASTRKLMRRLPSSLAKGHGKSFEGERSKYPRRGERTSGVRGALPSEPLAGRMKAEGLMEGSQGRFVAGSERVSPSAPFQIYLLSIESPERRKLTSPPARSRGDRFPAVSPEGNTIAFTRHSNNDTDDIYLAPVSGGEPTRLTTDNSVINGLSWTPDGREIIYSSIRGGARHI